MVAFLDNCDFNATSTGTGDFVVASAVTGHQTPASAAAVNAAVYRYYARSLDLSQWEQGFGAYTVGSVTLARTTVLFNSAGTTAKISFSTVPLVAVVVLAEDCFPLTTTTLTNTLGADVALNNIANYFAGPTVAQGTSGTWLATGSVTVLDPSLAVFFAKLWDGTTIIASAAQWANTNQPFAIHLSGIISAPAGNIRIDVRDSSNTTGAIKFNASGNSKDSTLAVLRIG